MSVANPGGGMWYSFSPPSRQSKLGEVVLDAAWGGVAHFAGCLQLGCAITTHVPVISCPSQSRFHQSSDAIAGSRLPFWRKMIEVLLAARGFKCKRQHKTLISDQNLVMSERS